MCVCIAKESTVSLIGLLDITILPAAVYNFSRPLAISKDSQTFVCNTRERIGYIFSLCKYVQIIENNETFTSRMQFKSKDYINNNTDITIISLIIM